MAACVATNRKHDEAQIGQSKFGKHMLACAGTLMMRFQSANVYLVQKHAAHDKNLTYPEGDREVEASIL